MEFELESQKLELGSCVSSNNSMAIAKMLGDILHASK